MKNYLPKVQKFVLVGFVMVLFTLFSFNIYSQYGENIVPNSDFESGNISGWTVINTTGAVSSLSATGDAYEGSGALLMDVTVGGINQTKAILSVDPAIENVSDVNTYKLSLVAKSIVADNTFYIQVRTFDAGDNLIAFRSPIYTFTSNYKEYSWLYTVEKGYNKKFEIRIQCGKAVDKIYFDNIKVEPVIGIANNNFEEEIDFGWTSNVNSVSGADATFEYESTNPYEGANSLKVIVNSVNDTASHIAINSESQFFVEETGAYELNFFAKGTDIDDSMKVVLTCFNNSNVNSYTISDTFSLTNSFKNYRLVFTPNDTISYVKASFQYGFNTGIYYLDDIQLLSYIAPSITSQAIENALVGTLYEYQVENIGHGVYSIETDVTADWLSIDSETGLISGTPTEEVSIQVTVILTDGENTDQQQYNLVILSTGVKEALKTSFIFYPNPTQDFLFFENLKPDANLKIFNIVGEKVYESKINQPSYKIDLGELENGVYFISYEQNNAQKEVRKFIKN